MPKINTKASSLAKLLEVNDRVTAVNIILGHDAWQPMLESLLVKNDRGSRGVLWQKLCTMLFLGTPKGCDASFGEIRAREFEPAAYEAMLLSLNALSAFGTEKITKDVIRQCSEDAISTTNAYKGYPYNITLTRFKAKKCAAPMIPGSDIADGKAKDAKEAKRKQKEDKLLLQHKKVNTGKTFAEVVCEQQLKYVKTNTEGVVGGGPDTGDQPLMDDVAFWLDLQKLLGDSGNGISSWAKLAVQVGEKPNGAVWKNFRFCNGTGTQDERLRIIPKLWALLASPQHLSTQASAAAQHIQASAILASAHHSQASAAAQHIQASAILASAQYIQAAQPFAVSAAAQHIQASAVAHHIQASAAGLASAQHIQASAAAQYIQASAAAQPFAVSAAAPHIQASAAGLASAQYSQGSSAEA
jgi:hypothetical protein